MTRTRIHWIMALVLCVDAAIVWTVPQKHSATAPTHSVEAPVQPSARECLALAAFTEARSEGAAGMAAVLDVIRNRQRDGSYPADACAVVRQRNQFIGVAGWTAARAERIDASSWSAALVLSSLSLDGVELVPHDCRGATHFDHAQSTRGLVPLCRLGVHELYREKRP